MQINREVILAGIESSYGVDPTLTAGANSVLVEEPAWANEGLRMTPRAGVRPSQGKLQSVYGGRLMKLTFAVEVKGSGTAGTAPELGPLLRMCGWAETVVPATSVTYLPVSDTDSHESGTIYYYRHGKRYIMTGCRGAATLQLTAGDPAKINFAITGHVGADADVALVTPSYDDVMPPPVTGAAFSIGGYTPVCNSLSLDMGTVVSMLPSVNASDGYGEIRISDRNPTGSIDPEETLVATNDWIGDFVAGTNMAFDSGVIGSAGNRFQLTMPAIYYTDAAPGDREGTRTLEIPFGCLESSGDDEVSLAFT